MGLARGALLAFVMITVLTLAVGLAADRVVAGTMSYRTVDVNWVAIAKQLGL